VPKASNKSWVFVYITFCSGFLSHLALAELIQLWNPSSVVFRLFVVDPGGFKRFFIPQPTL